VWSAKPELQKWLRILVLRAGLARGGSLAGNYFHRARRLYLMSYEGNSPFRCAFAGGK
jgi:hypothetical protein